MPKASHGQSPKIAHVSITLDDVTPEVSRIVAVPLGIHLDMLHLVIQAAMGWSNTHLWLFQPCGWGVPSPDFGYGDGPNDAGRTTLLDMIADIGTNRFEYVYDFGDHRSHTIKIVKPMPAVPGVAYPLLIDATGRCPLEDSGDLKMSACIPASSVSLIAEQSPEWPESFRCAAGVVVRLRNRVRLPATAAAPSAENFCSIIERPTFGTHSKA
jgi:hypothetical protein